jgi:hypothetical protein
VPSALSRERDLLVAARFKQRLVNEIGRQHGSRTQVTQIVRTGETTALALPGLEHFGQCWGSNLFTCAHLRRPLARGLTKLSHFEQTPLSVIL